MDKKTERLVNVARMYYEQDRTQSEIADRYGISRPMVSKLLKEGHCHHPDKCTQGGIRRRAVTDGTGGTLLWDL